MNILLLGSGGREHAFAKSISSSVHCDQLFIAPGNAGTLQCGTNVNISPTNFPELKKFSLENKISMIVVGPEDPLVKGIVDFFQNDDELKHISVMGPSMEGAKLEGSKAFSKAFMQRNGIPTAGYQTFTVSKIDDANRFIDELNPPYVLKASGLAAGKGVLIINDPDEAKSELKQIFFKDKFGEAGNEVVIEEFLHGVEVSVFVLTDGTNYVLLPEAKDYKRIGDGDKGLNTGGMGAISPVPFVTAEFLNKVKERIIQPTVSGLKKENLLYKGFIFFGLMKVNDDPYLIEYNCRMGDPETEAVLPRIKTDLVDLFLAVRNETLDKISLEISDEAAACVMMVSGGYPGNYEKGFVINGMENVSASLVFHGGTIKQNHAVLTNGGRVLAVTSLDDSIEKAITKSYQSVQQIHFDFEYYRKDIGKDLIVMNSK